MVYNITLLGTIYEEKWTDSFKLVPAKNQMNTNYTILQ